MGIDAIMDASRAGLQNERLRLDQASRSIASANQPIAPAALQRTAEGGFAAALAEGDGSIVATRQVFDPKHPLADAQGMVHYPQVDMVSEMTTMLTASRGYEANVRSFNILRGMVLRALEIGAK